MINLQNSNNTYISKNGKRRIFKPSLFVLVSFIPVCVLYYFLRFQFNFDREILGIYLLLQGLIAFLVFYTFTKENAGNFRLNVIDQLVLIVFCHSIYLLAFTLVRSPGIDSLLYSLKDYIFPVLIYWYCRRFRSKLEWVGIFKLIAFVMTIVSVVYIAEFYERIVLGNPPFAYTEKVRALTMDITSSDTLTGTVIKGDIYTLIRFEGPLSHNNVTGLAMAIGVLLSFVLARELKNNIFILTAMINFAGLLFAGPRTAMFAMAVSGAVYLWSVKKEIHGARENRFAKFVALTVAVLMLMSVFYFIDFSAYDQIYNIDSMFNTLISLLSANREFGDLTVLFRNPINWLGSGFPVPGDWTTAFNVVRSDDLFFIQLISMYGLIGGGVLFSGILQVLKQLIVDMRRPSEENRLVYQLGLVVVIAMLVSTVHTNALIRPQLFPLFYISLAAMSAYLDGHLMDSRKENSCLTKI